MSCPHDRSSAHRRRFLRGLLAAGGAAVLPAPVRAMGVQGARLQQYDGRVMVDGRPPEEADPLRPGSRIVTAGGAGAAFVIDGIAGVLGARTGLELDGDDDRVRVLRLVTGALMAVFDPDGRERALVTPVATAGIRGTGVYAEARDHRESYICTCFGAIELQSGGGQRERVDAVAHSARRVLADADGDRILRAPRTGHTDADVHRAARMVGVEAFPRAPR